VAAADPEQPVSMAQSMAELVATDTEGRTTQIRVLGAFALAALVLAAVGIHGLLAFSVSERQKEIGVRMALGALPAAILRLVIGEGVRLAAVGIALGVVAAGAAGRALESLLAGVSPFDGAAFGAAAAICGLTTLAGCIGPSLRAVRVDPLESIRAE
jgi:putative ABC transport system permease protein